MAFAKPSGDPLPVLANIDMSLREGEILGLLGRSGSGKSTLLRIAGGLIQPASGEVRYRGSAAARTVRGHRGRIPDLCAVPVALGAAKRGSRGSTRSDCRVPRAGNGRCAAIDLIGLDGFQSAYPRELSGGMRQRVGFARAIVTEPIVLLMDEPFSALDVLTAETLRTDFLDLWTGHQLSTKAVLLVTHNIEEAVLMCDRILVLASNPGRICRRDPSSAAAPARSARRGVSRHRR